MCGEEGQEVREGKGFFNPRYTSEAMGSSVVDVKAEKPNDESTARLTRCWADEHHGSTARIKLFDRGTIAANF